MPALLTKHIATINLETASDGADYSLPTGKIDTFRVQSVLDSGSFGGAIITAEQSIDGANWAGLDDALTINSEAISAAQYLRAVALLRFRVTTDQSGTAGVAQLWLFLTSSSLDELVWNDLS